MKLHGWKRERQTKQLIVQRLIEKGIQETPELEKEPYIPHATLRQILDKMIAAGEITELESIRVSKRHLPVKRYQLTEIGVINWLSDYNSTFDQKLVKKAIQEYFALVSIVINRLQKLFSDNELIMSLSDVFKNTKIDILRTTDPKKIWFGVPASLLMKKFLWIIGYYITVKISHDNFDYFVHDKALSYK